MSYTISGIQQLGVGVSDVHERWTWYRHHFGMDVPVFRDEAEAPLMTRYTGNAVQKRDAVLALNLAGGAGFEIWQFTSRTSVAPSFTPAVGDTGIYAGKLKAPDVRAAYDQLSSAGITVTGPPEADPAGNASFFVTDPAGNSFQIIEARDWFQSPRGVTGGVAGALIGTSDVDNVLPLFRDVLGYDTLVYDERGVFPDLSRLPGGDRRMRRVRITHAAARTGPFSELIGRSNIEFVELLNERPRKIFEQRFWGDLGFIHLCFDVRGMNDLAAACAGAGFPFTVDSAETFDMGQAGGRFSYVEDADGTLYEFVETHKVPIAKKLGLSLNLARRPADKTLPRWMIRTMGLGRVK